MGAYELVVRYYHTGPGEPPSEDELRRVLVENTDGMWLTYIRVETLGSSRKGLMPAREQGRADGAVFREEQDG